MSHLAQYEPSLTEDINQDLLKKAMKVVASKLGGTLSETIDGYDEGPNVKSWHGKKIFASIRTKNLPQGVGIVLDAENKIHYVADILCAAEKATNLVRNDKFHAIKKKSEDDFKAITGEIEKTYKILGFVEGLQSENWHNIKIKTVGQHILIDAEKE